jgi:hypothetical protein
MKDSQRKALQALYDTAVKSGSAEDHAAFQEAFRQIQALNSGAARSGPISDYTAKTEEQQLITDAITNAYQRRPDMIDSQPSYGPSTMSPRKGGPDRRRPDMMDSQPSSGPLGTRRPDMMDSQPAARDNRRPDMMDSQPGAGVDRRRPDMMGIAGKMPLQPKAADYAYSMYEPEAEAPVATLGRSFVRDSKGNPVLDSKGKPNVFAGPAKKAEPRSYSSFAEFFGK